MENVIQSLIYCIMPEVQSDINFVDKLTSTLSRRFTPRSLLSIYTRLSIKMFIP